MALLTSDLWFEALPTSIVVTLLTTLLALAFTPFFRRPSFPKSAPAILKGTPILGSIDFFLSRYRFIRDGTIKSATGNFSFSYGPHSIVSLSGEQARHTYFNTRGFDVSAGFQALFAGGPDASRPDDSQFNSRLMGTFRRLVTKDRLLDMLDHLTGDVQGALDPISARAKQNGGFAVIDMFDEYFRLTYKLTHRALGPKDIADDPKLLESTLKAYQGLDVGSPTEIMFPWLPTVTKVKKLWAGYNIFSTLTGIVKKRRTTGKTEDDAVQLMMDRGDSDMFIATFIISALFAGLINSGINAARIICYLAESPRWYEKCMIEVNRALDKHRQSPTETPADILPRLSLEDWQSFPDVYLCLRETIRLNMPGTSARKNISGKDIQIAGSNQVVPAGMYAVYLMDDALMNPEIYKDPYTFDPDRYLPGREEDKKADQAYIGWGSGLHPCLGKKFAELEVTITTVMFLAYYDFELSDEVGKPRWAPVPGVPRDAYANELPEEKIYMKCTPRF